MVLVALGALLVILFFYNIKLFTYSLMVYFVFFDMFDGFYEDNQVLAAIRYFIPLSLAIFYVFKYNAFKKSDTIFLILIVYLFFLWIINSGDLLVSTRALLSILITFLMIPIGKHLSESVDFLEEFEPYNRVLLLAVPFYIVVANIIGFGGFYTEEFSTGFLITSRMYIVPIVVFLAIHYLLSNPNKSKFIRLNDMLFILINMGMLIINTRRTTLAMLLGSVIIYALFNRKLILKLIVFTFIAIAGLIVSYPLYEDRLTAQLEQRERIQDLDTYEEEGRYLETLYIIDYHERKASLFEFIFGVKLFDSYEFGTKYFGRDRPIHSDINMIFFSTGLFGTVLFFLFFLHYFFSNNLLISSQNKKIFYPLLFMLVMVLIPGRFIGTLTYAPFLMLLLSTVKFGNTSLNSEEQTPELEPSVTL